jgi:1-deoxy-D-xylulose-5-phosphate reductoisomerase
MKPAQLEVVIHPQSVIHSMVQYQDNSVVAQLGTPDMRVPIAYGLSWPERMTSGASALDFHALAAMTFEAMDDHGHPERFPGLNLAWETLNGAPGSCALLNAANEISVEAFLNRHIRFDQIHAVNRATLDRITNPAPQNLEDLMDLDRRGREAAKSIVKALNI